MARATATDAVKLVIVELLRRKECTTIDEVVERALQLLRSMGVSVAPEALRHIAKTVVYRRGRELGACWAPGEPGRVCRC